MLTALASLNDSRLWAGRVVTSFLSFVSVLRFVLALSLGLFLPWFFADCATELVSNSLDFPCSSTEARVTFNSLFFTLTTRPTTFAPFGITVFPSTWTGVESLAANVSPTWFLLLARVWPTVALIAVPFGTVTIVAGCGALLETVAAFGVSAFSGVAAASLVAWFEQPATVKNPAAAAASQSLRWN